MKILILIPVYKRPEVLRLCLANLVWFIRNVRSWRIEVVCLLSPEDSMLKENRAIVARYGFKEIFYHNLPVADKLNAGIEWALRCRKWDYLMNFGSDDLIHPEIERPYADHFRAKRKFFGINTLYFYDLKTHRTLFFDTYNTNGAIGAGRMVHRSLLKALSDDQIPIYEPGLSQGLDCSSAMAIKRQTGVTEVIIDSGRFPYIVDIKTHTNINHMTMIEQRTKNIIPYPSNYLKRYYAVL